MTWGSWNDFLAMGGYGFYVWGSYAVTAALMAAEIVAVRRRTRAALDATRGLRATTDEGKR
jgi:heme exporter protein D